MSNQNLAKQLNILLEKNLFKDSFELLELNLKQNQIVGIGDAANDMNMLLSVGLPIAFKAQEIVKANFENQINNTDLTSVLYFLGIKH